MSKFIMHHFYIFPGHLVGNYVHLNGFVRIFPIKYFIENSKNFFFINARILSLYKNLFVLPENSMKYTNLYPWWNNNIHVEILFAMCNRCEIVNRWWCLRIDNSRNISRFILLSQWCLINASRWLEMKLLFDHSQPSLNIID